jgi:hypothetical protein
MKTAISLLIVFTFAITLALVVTVISSATEVGLLALVLVTPQVVLSVAFIYFC